MPAVSYKRAQANKYMKGRNIIMDKKLKSMFEYQKFAQNSRLSKLIADTENRYASHELADDDLWLVNAAGAPEMDGLDSGKKKNNPRD